MDGFPLFDTIRMVGLPPPQGVLQLGASYGQEMNDFLAANIRYGVFIEPLPQPFAYLSALCKQIPNYVAVQTLCSDLVGKKFQFHVASNGGMSSSILKPANHLSIYEQVTFPGTIDVVSTTVDHVLDFLGQQGYGHIVPNLDLLFMDTQGAEFKILLGAYRALQNIKYIYTEVMRGDLYEDQVPFLTYCNYLDSIGFTLNTVEFGAGHAGNALFIRKDILGVQH